MQRRHYEVPTNKKHLNMLMLCPSTSCCLWVGDHEMPPRCYPCFGRCGAGPGRDGLDPFCRARAVLRFSNYSMYVRSVAIQYTYCKEDTAKVLVRPSAAGATSLAHGLTNSPNPTIRLDLQSVALILPPLVAACWQSVCALDRAVDASDKLTVKVCG